MYLTPENAKDYVGMKLYADRSLLGCYPYTVFQYPDKGAFKELFGFDKEIAKKIVDIYNYMAEKRTPNMYLQFESGIKINISIDVSEYRGQIENPDRLEGE